MSHLTVDHLPLWFSILWAMPFCSLRHTPLERHHIYPAFVFLSVQLSPIPAPTHPSFFSLPLFLYLALSCTDTLKQTELRSSTYLALILIKPTHWSIMLPSQFLTPSAVILIDETATPSTTTTTTTMTAKQSLTNAFLRKKVFWY